jgi:hypothetical protein
MVYFIFWIFFNETWHICRWADGHEKIITWKFHWNRPRNKWYRANIVQNLYYGKCTGKRSKTWNFSLPKKFDLRKTKHFRDWPSSFGSTYPNICDRTKRMDNSYEFPWMQIFQPLFKSPIQQSLPMNKQSVELFNPEKNYCDQKLWTIYAVDCTKNQQPHQIHKR